MSTVVKTFAFGLATMALASCGSQYNHFTKDKNEANKYVYGDIDGPARQLKNTYPAATSETVEKATKFRALVESELTSGYGAN